MTLIAWFTAAVLPLAKKVLIGLGFGIISYASITALVNALVSQVQSLWGQIGAGQLGAVLQILQLCGFNSALGIILGAFTARAAIVAVEKLGRLAT